MAAVLEAIPQLTQLQNDFRGRGFHESQPLDSPHEFVEACLVWGAIEGNQTPRILLIALENDHWEYSNEARLDELAYELLATVNDDWPVFAYLADEKNQRAFALFGLDGTDGTHSIDDIPSIDLIREYERLNKNTTLKWSMQIYTRLMHKLDAFHEQVYQTVKDRVSDKNDIIEEVAKILFLETFRVHHESQTFNFDGDNLNFRDVFDYHYVEQHGEKAVKQIQAAFDELKLHPDYVVVTDDGKGSSIFDAQMHLRLEQPENYRTLLEAIQNLGPVTTNEGKVVKDQGTLADVAGDVLGRVFDVFLRANFESKGGLGVYLTPNPVKQAMLEIAFHDIQEDTQTVQELVAGEFRFCDPTCGSFGFGSVALSRMDAVIDNMAGLSDTEREKLKQQMREEGFIGADSAPRMVMLARVNMALQGAPKAKIFYTDNSLTTNALQPNTFNLICTNPPFGTPKFKSDKKGKESKQQYERNMNRILEGFDRNDGTRFDGFQTDLVDVAAGKKPRFELRPTTDGLSLGSKPDSKGNWNPVKGGSIDPAVLFIDRCLQLLKPGGRLLIVLPDGILCNSGDRYVREYMMGKKDEQTGEFVGGKAIVKAVISLPADTFKLSGTGAKTSILYLQKRHARDDDSKQFLPEPQSEVFMAVADTLGYLVKNNIEDYSAGVPNDLDEIVGFYNKGA